MSRYAVGMTFRVRTALVVLALTALTMGCAFAAVWERFVSAQRTQLDDALFTVARREADEAAAGQLEFTDAPGPSANAVGPLPKYGVIYGINGSPLADTHNFTTLPTMPRAAPFDKAFDFEHDGLPMRGVIVGAGNTGKRVLLATTRLDFEEDSRILMHAMAVAFLVGCLWAAIVGYGVATHLTREHRMVAYVARTVASGDTSARVAFRSADSDLRQLAKDLNAMIERLVGLNAMQERFVAHAAHELRTPLTSLRVELEHAMRTARSPADYDEALKGALDSATRLTDLAEDLLQLAKLKAKTPDGATTVLEDALADAVADVAPVARTREVSIVASPLSAVVKGDRRGVARLLRNVLENAVRFSPSGGSVRVETSDAKGRIQITVRDEGPGIAKGDEERIFEPFERGTHNDTSEGSGLGLSIARGLARTFGGDVTALHDDEGGGQVIVSLSR